MTNKDKVTRKLEVLMDVIQDKVTRAYLSDSKNGVPHLIVRAGDEGFSIAYFLTTKTYRVFHPYPAHGREQTKTNFKKPKEIAALFDFG